ncbi:MAG: aminotransferase class V-fold PLP-dependent enzyme [Thermodesulfobacteriota bacterium]|nr:aminotransferase class V-fold PLP-dependent enzyme [Thermodesulfobacteriota bacterium]
MTSALIYCDQAATSFPKPPGVIEAVARSLANSSASPGRSAHRMSLSASKTVFEAREAVAELFRLDDSSRIAFTCNVTQALNMSLSGFLNQGDHVLTTSLEHNSVMRPLSRLSRSRGVEVEVVPVPPKGRIDPAEFRDRIRDNTKLAMVNHASNVIGTICPLKEIKSALGKTPLLVDAAQTAGALPLFPLDDRIDMLAFTGHKALLGPTGTGGLWVRPGLDLRPLVLGGTGSRSELEEQPEFMPDALEAGTPNTHGLAGLAAGVNFILEKGLDKVRAHELNLTHIFMDGLTQIKAAESYGPPDPAARAAVVSLNLAGWSPSDLALTLDREFGIMTRAGLHCSPRAHRTIGSFPQGAVRFSFGVFNTRAEVETVLTTLDGLSRRTN